MSEPSVSQGRPTRSESIVIPFLMWATLQVIYVVFSISVSVRALYHAVVYRISASGAYHHRSPQLIRSDVANLSKIPEHIAVILNANDGHVEKGGIDGLLHDVGEITSWCIGAGTKNLTVYEKRGVLKTLPPQDVFKAVKERLETYFGVDGVPSFEITHANTNPVKYENGVGSSTFKVNLLSERDGRPVIVQLARTFAEYVRESQLKPEEITVDFVDRELKDLVGNEPDLIVLFTPQVDLQGFPPWHVRVSEIFYLPDNRKVSYLVFKKALEKFSNVKINLGR